jgi:hypothetical protein
MGLQPLQDEVSKKWTQPKSSCFYGILRFRAVSGNFCRPAALVLGFLKHGMALAKHARVIRVRLTETQYCRLAQALIFSLCSLGG